MIFPALAAGLACLGLVAFDVWRHPGHRLAVLRAPVAIVWAASLLAYGVNLLHFPFPGTGAWLLMVAGCAIGLLMFPSPVAHDTTSIEHSPLPRMARAYFYLLLGVTAAVAAWDLWHLIEKTRFMTLSVSLMDQRWDRSNKTGLYAIPGMEVAHAMAGVTGALGYALWLRDRQRTGLVAACLALSSMLTSTGRWDVVAYCLWCFTLEALLPGRLSTRRLLVSQACVFGLLGVFFILHGRLLGKIEGMGNAVLASGGAQVKPLEMPGKLEHQGPALSPPPPPPGSPVAAAPPVHVAAGPRPSPTETAPRRVPAPVAAPAPAQAVPAPPESSMKTAPPVCQRWQAGARLANQTLRGFPDAAKVMIVYFAGPYAAFDRALCEAAPVQRVVLFYWPNKIGRLLRLLPPGGTLVVDPNIDIGVPFNNYTVMYPFWGELGAAVGLLAWLATALLLRCFMRWALDGRFGLPGIVAGAAPLTIAIRAPWANSFFDGTLVVYVAVALGVWWVSRARRVAPGERQSGMAARAGRY